MFNGIINHTGKIRKIIKKKNNIIIEIFSNIKFKIDEIGSSVSCSGVCLTLEKKKRNILKFYLSKETMNKTNFKYLKIGDVINIEKSLKYGNRVSGHFVQGHVDTTSFISKINVIGKSWYMYFKIPKKFIKYVAYKGSIAINGVSLTISKILNNGFQIVIIPQTLKCTNLIHLKKNDLVNIEFDILGKYIERFINKKK